MEVRWHFFFSNQKQTSRRAAAERIFTLLMHAFRGKRAVKRRGEQAGTHCKLPLNWVVCLVACNIEKFMKSNSFPPVHDGLLALWTRVGELFCIIFENKPVH